MPTEAAERTLGLQTLVVVCAALSMGGCWSRSVRSPMIASAVTGEMPASLDSRGESGLAFSPSTSQPAAQGRAAGAIVPGAATEVAWPARDGEVCAELVARTPGQVRPFVLRAGTNEAELSERERMKLARVSHVVHYAGVHAGGALRLFDVQRSRGEIERGWAPSESDLRSFYGFVPSGSFITSRGLMHRENREYREYRESSAWMIDRLNEREEQRRVMLSGQENDLALESGMAVRAPLPASAQGAMADVAGKRGLVVHLAALSGNPFEPPVIERLERDGWVVVSLDTIAGVPTPRNTSARAQRNTERAKLRTIDDELRTLPGTLGNRPEHARARELVRERTRVVASLRALDRSEALRSFEICDVSQAEEVGRAIAREIDESLASNAYCAHALVHYVHAQYPALADKPVVLLGFSAGALALPTAAVRLREQGVRVSAMVMVGGGADLFRVATESELTDGGIRLRCTQGEGSRDNAPKAPSKEVSRAVHDAYLRASQLDPLRLAPSLRETPTLMLHASWDTWVPASTGDALWEAMGKPDRWTLMLGGHAMLFYFLPTQAGRIAQWMNEQAR